jgi:septum formation protein
MPKPVPSSNPPSGLWREEHPLVLASASVARRQILEAAGIPVEVAPAHLDERATEAGLAHHGVSPGDVARVLAREKALAVSRRSPGRYVVGADQTLDCEGRRFNKPESPAAAARQIAALAGRTHHLHAAIALALDGKVVFETLASAAMTMRPLAPGFVARYVELVGEGVSRSVGAYQVEGLGIHLFDRIEGDYSAILGLPILPLLAALRREGCLAG